MNMQSLSFDRAITLSTDLIASIENKECTAGEAMEHLTNILSSQNGARGFFVALLTGEFELARHCPSEFIDAFRAKADIICDLLTKNLVMSSTMAVTHRKNNDSEKMNESKAVAEKTAKIIQAMQIDEMDRCLADMAEAVETKLDRVDEDKSYYGQFLTRWKYDAEQLVDAQVALRKVKASES